MFICTIIFQCAFDKDNCLRRFTNVTDILKEFFTLRLSFYEKRKNYLEGILDVESRKLTNQARCVILLTVLIYSTTIIVCIIVLQLYLIIFLFFNCLFAYYFSILRFYLLVNIFLKFYCITCYIIDNCQEVATLRVVKNVNFIFT